MRQAFITMMLVSVGTMASMAAIAQDDVRVTDVVSGNRTVALTWSKALGDTLTPEERLFVPEINFSLPVVLGIKTAGIRNGDFIVGRGAGGVDRGNWLVRVGNVEDFFERGEEPPGPPRGMFNITGAFQFGRDFVAVAYSESVNVAEATDPSNYSFVPGLTVSTPRLQENSRTVIFPVANLSPGTSYQVTVNGVTSNLGEPLPSGAPINFQTVPGPVVNLADIQNDRASYRNQTVTVVGQVYIPTSSRGSFASGYIQDGSGRGINLFSGPVLGTVNNTTNVVEVTGTVVDPISAVSVTGYTANLLTGGQPKLGPKVISLRESLSSKWEGTYIQTGGHMSRIDAKTDPTLVNFTATTRDTAFAGYRMWRGFAEGAAEYELLRSYSLLDSTWTFVDDGRIFIDPDSIILRGTERDIDAPDKLAGPFNGVGYFYSATWFEAVLDHTVFPPRTVLFERTTPAEGVFHEPVFPSKLATASVPLLGNVKVVPNPYNPAAAFGRGTFPGSPRIQFINLPSKATVEVYSTAGDLVRILDKTDDPTTDFIDWDLKNQQGQNVAPGVYVFMAKTDGEAKSGRFVIVR